MTANEINALVDRLREQRNLSDAEFKTILETDAYDEQIYHSGKDVDVSGLLSHIRKKAVQYREAVRGEKLIGLSTCADDVGTNGRVVVFGWLDETSAGREV